MRHRGALGPGARAWDVIVVAGASGYVGGLVAAELAGRGEPMRLLGRDPARLPKLPGAEPVRADYGDPGSLATALGEGDRVFMVSMHTGPETRVPLHRSFVEAAARAQVGLVVYLSFVNASPEATFVHARSHGATEQLLRQSGLASTSIRNSMYADELPGWFDADGVAREPVGDGRMSFSYRPELAKAIAAVLTGEGHEGRIYDVTTPDSAGFAELAELASAVTGKSYRYEPAGHDEWDARWRAQGRSGWELDAGHTAYEAIAKGELDVVSDDYRTLTGLEPLTIPEVLSALRDELPVR